MIKLDLDKTTLRIASIGILLIGISLFYSLVIVNYKDNEAYRDCLEKYEGKAGYKQACFEYKK